MEIVSKDIIMCCLLVVAICNDCIFYKVRNFIIVSGLLVGLVVQFLEAGGTGIINWILGVCIPIVLLWVLFRYKMLGAGDIKLFSIIGGMYGASVIIDTIILAFLAGGVLSVIRLLQTGGLKNRLQYLAAFISNQCEQIQVVSYYQKERDGREPVIHFTVAIGIGFLLCRFWGISF